MSEFVKRGERILVKPQGLDYDLKFNKVYKLLYDDWNEIAYLEEDGGITIPSKVFFTEKDKKFKEKILNNFENTAKDTTGVMLTGVKGSGKTMLSKIIAQESNLPIIIVDPKYPTKQLNSFFTCIYTPCCILFDEVDKNINYKTGGRWNTTDLLSFLDGIQNTCKKLVVFTCNDMHEISEYLRDRCSRIRYYKEYTETNEELVRIIVEDMIKDKDKTEELVDFIISKFVVKTFDNVISFLEEYEEYPDTDLLELAGDLNITLKNDN